MIKIKRLENDYPEAFLQSCKLFGEDVVLVQLPRLNEIYNVTEEKWEANVQRLLANNIKLKYLLIAEAAPWSTDEHVTYFYNGDFSGLGDAILPSFSIYESDLEKVYLKLAEKQFILIDSLPFSFRYPSQKKGSMPYKQMVKECSGYLKTKLFDPRLQWESDVKVGFGYKLNAQAIMKALNNHLMLPNGKTIVLHERMIVADS